MKRTKLKLPDLYLIDSRKLLAEIDRIHQQVLAIPPTAESHSAVQTVVDSLWHLRRDMEDIIRVQGQIHQSFAQKAEALAEANRKPEVGLRVFHQN